MQINVKKIEERIQKLQEIKRIASDPELVAMLLEFIANDDERKEPAPAAKAHSAAGSRADDLDLVNQVMKGMDLQGAGAGAGKRG